MNDREGGRGAKVPRSFRAARSPQLPRPEAEMGEPARLVPAADKAARLLALRPHFRRELEVKLERSGYGREEVAEALETLVRLAARPAPRAFRLAAHRLAALL